MVKKLDRLNGSNSSGIAFQKLWQKNAELVEAQFADLASQLAAITAAQATASAAAATATAAARESARINSYPNPGGILSAVDAGTTASITIANHTRVYPVQGSIDVPDVAITGATLTGKAFSTRYFIYYDDITLALAAPSFVATTDSASAQVGGAQGRHFVGFVDTPADGGSGTSGTGGGTPGGGGGGGSYGGYIP